jgi:hypothetical protein
MPGKDGYRRELWQGIKGPKHEIEWTKYNYEKNSWGQVRG